MREPIIQTINASEARQQWSELLKKVFRKEARVLVEKSGIPVAAIVSTEDLQRLKQLDADREALFRALERIGEAFKDESPEEIEREVTRALSQARAENRSKAAQTT
jgi:prevent-host-death family protein